MVEVNKIYQGDCLEVLKTLPNESIDCVITSPPYWALRDYGVDGQLGLEPTFQEYINKLCDIFDEVKRVLKKEGTCWVNIGDTYSNSCQGDKRNKWEREKGIIGNRRHADGHKTDLPDKTLIQIPSRFAIEMSNRGWILRNEIIWHKPACMPQSVRDRFTVDFEKIFFFVKNKKYYFEQQKEPIAESSKNDKRRGRIQSNNAKWDGFQNQTIGKMKSFAYIEDGGRNKRTVWTISTRPFKEAHFATYPEKLIETPIKAGCPKDGIVLDPFFGAGTTGVVARKFGRNYLGIELNNDYIKIAEKRLAQEYLF